MELTFPKNFFKMNGKNIMWEKINEYIKEVLSSQNEYDSISCGNTIVIKHHDKIIIAKDYWITDIDD